MEFKIQSAEVVVPDGIETVAALARTTHMGIGAHQDDLEIFGVVSGGAHLYAHGSLQAGCHRPTAEAQRKAEGLPCRLTLSW